MRGEAVAKYVPAMAMAPLGALDPVYGSVAFGMVTGWLAIAGVMYDQRKSFGEIRRALVVSLLIGGGGALAAVFAVRKMNLDPLGAAMLAFGIAFGGVRTIKAIGNGMRGVVEWIVGSLIDDAAKMGRKRQEAHIMELENTQADRERMARRLFDNDATGVRPRKGD